MKKIIITLFFILFNIIFLSKSNAFLYGAIYSLESLNIAKANNIEISPPFNSRTYCLISQRKYNAYFKDYIRSTCFQKEGDPYKYYYLICPKEFQNCSLDLYLGDPLNAQELKGEIGKSNDVTKCDTMLMEGDLFDENKKNEILEKVNKILDYQRNTSFAYDLDTRSREVINTIKNMLDKNNLNLNEKLEDFVDRIYKKYEGKGELDLSKMYTIESMYFIEENTSKKFSLKDLLDKNVGSIDSNKVYRIQLVLKDNFGIKYNINFKFDKNSQNFVQVGGDYDIEKIINGIFMDDNGNEYEIDDVINTIFEEDNNFSTSMREFSNNEESNSVNEFNTTSENNSVNLGGQEEELSMKEILDLVFKEE